ncbi:glutathione S-transferase family protein [Undibacter mobilis]|uniref:Glutathione S-transferase n=1 Tax=Undibacter mobilis TaxID=2292256 RepID=A0A371B8Y9_9BRAD|nr:glutathione S-transferase [Undibacter mobilis]RDV04002.1 glutathione S-transferase [Undibacter mobilis]
MLKIWGRKTSSNVQKVMWAVGELGLAHERIDVGGAFGKTREPPYSDMNPNATVPTLEEPDGFTLWESNTICRYLGAKYDKANVLEPQGIKQRARASQWMDWQLSVIGPNITPVFWGLIRTPPEQRDMALIKTMTEKTVANMQTLDAQLAKTAYVAGDMFSYGDIPVGIMCYRYVQLVPERPATPNLDRWYAAISSRQAFKDHVGAVPLS